VKKRPAIPVTRWVRVRIAGVATALTLLFCAVAYRAYGLQIRDADHYRALAHRQHTATVEVPAPRGAIRDAAGRELAVTADIESVYVNPREVHEIGSTAERLAELLEVDAAEIEARLSSPRYFAWIERHVSAAEARAVRAAALPGIYLTPEPRRYYPGGPLAGPVLGFAGIDGRGLDGLELTMDRMLQGQRATGAGLRDASGDIMLPEATTSTPGATVILTLDRFIQFAAERALHDTIEKQHALAGVIIAIDVKTGDVLALASAPGYDPNQPGSREAAARNRAVTDVFEIGSIMKTFSVAAALDAGAVTPSSTFDVEGGRFKVGRKTIRDTYHDQILTTGGVLKRSSNVGAVKIAQRLGRDRLHDAYVRLGFGARTGIELPGEEPGLVWPAKKWGEIGLATMAFGYGLSVTPIQVAAAFAAIANGGVYHPPRIVREVRSARGEVLYARAADEGRRVLSHETAMAMRPMLGSVFDQGKDGGTGRHLVIDGARPGGKSGTAHKIDPATGKYAEKLYLSSFAGFAPLEDPRVAVLVLIDEPHGDAHYGAVVAGPPWVDVLTASLRYLGIASAGEVEADVPDGGPSSIGGSASPAPSARWAPPEPPTSEPEAPELDVAEDGAHDGVGMPDFTGLGMVEVLELARERGIRVEVIGSGRAIEQFPSPGQAGSSAECRVTFAHESAVVARSE
jgi:cell division protein FtsI (penicillin-binding protein 3)